MKINVASYPSGSDNKARDALSWMDLTLTRWMTVALIFRVVMVSGCQVVYSLSADTLWEGSGMGDQLLPLLEGHLREEDMEWGGV